MIRIITLCLFMTISIVGYAQKRDVVLIDYFSKEREIPLVYAERIRQQVMEGFMRKNREDIVDAQQIPEMNPQRMGGYRNGNNFEADRNNAIQSSGARYLIAGHVAGYKFTKNIVDGKVQFNSTFKVLLNGYDLSTGEKLAPEQYDLTGRANNIDEADAKAIVAITSKINYYIQTRMKFETEVLDICEANAKGQVLQLYIGAGSDMGVNAGDQFDLYEVDFVQGRYIRKSVGRVTVRSVDGPRASLCTMKKKQAPVIIKSFESGKKVIAVSAGQALFF